MALISDPDYARAVADACVLPAGGVPDVGGGDGRCASGTASARPDSNASRLSGTNASIYPDPAAACPDDTDTEHANRDLRQMADHGRGLGRRQPDVDYSGPVRDYGRPGVSAPHGSAVRDPSGSEVIRYSSMPDLIDEIRRERDELRERLTAIETMHRAWAQLDRNALWFALRHYLETGDTR